MRAQVDELDGPWQKIGREHGDDRGAHDLPAVGDREDPRDPVEGGAEVVAVARFRCARVEGHPDSQRSCVAPGDLAKRPLRGERRVDRG